VIVSRSAGRSASSRRRGSQFCWSSRISLRGDRPIGITLWTTAVVDMIPNSADATWTSCTNTWV
jgi:hypothetical protein